MKNKLKNILPIIMLVFLASCSWMGEARLPTVNSPDDFISKTNANDNIESLPYLAWWQQFGDKSLNNLIESSLKNNLQIGIALANLDSARGQLTQVNLGWLPGMSFFAGYSTNPAMGDPGTFVGPFPTYTLNIASQIQQGKQAGYGVKYYTAALDGARLDVISAISATYFTLSSQQQQLILLEQYNEDLLSLIKFAQTKLRIGIQSDIELSSLQSQQKLILAQIELTKHNIQLSNNSMSFLLNQNPQKVNFANDFTRINFDGFNPGALPATVLSNRPDIKMAEYAVQIAHTKVGIDYAALFPTIQLDTFFGLLNGAPKLTMPKTYGAYSDAYSVTGVEPSIFGAIEADKGAYVAQAYEYVKTVRNALKNTDNAFSANYRYQNNYTQTLLAYQALANKYKLQTNLYKSGISSYPDLLQDKLTIDDFKIRLNQAKLQHAMALVTLYQQLAGGYKYNTAESNYNYLNLNN